MLEDGVGNCLGGLLVGCICDADGGHMGSQCQSPSENRPLVFGMETEGVPNNVEAPPRFCGVVNMVVLFVRMFESRAWSRWGVKRSAGSYRSSVAVSEISWF